MLDNLTIYNLHIYYFDNVTPESAERRWPLVFIICHVPRVTCFVFIHDFLSGNL